MSLNAKCSVDIRVKIRIFFLRSIVKQGDNKFISLKLTIRILSYEALKLKVHIQSSEALKLKVCT